MIKREYLVSLGLCNPGSRGRLSKDAKTALADAIKLGIIFDDLTGTELEEVGDIIEPPKPVRDLGEEIIGYTRGGYVFPFTHCRACGKGINFCLCSHITAPAIIENLPDDSPAIIVRSRRFNG